MRFESRTHAPEDAALGRGLWTRSLRFRLTLWYTGVLALILAPAAWLLYGGVQRALRTEADAFLTGEARRISLVAAGNAGDPPDLADLKEAVASQRGVHRAGRGSTPGAGTPGGAGLLLFDVVYARLVGRPGYRTVVRSADLQDQPALEASLDPLLRKPLPAGGVSSFAGPGEEDLTRVLTLPVRVGDSPGILQIAVPWDHNADVLERLGLLLAVGVPVVLLLAAGGGWTLVGRTLRPIARIVTEAERLDAPDLPEALLPEAGESDGEIGHLIATLNRMTTRLRRAFEVQRQFAEAQQRFAADASHELRTPLTILRGEMELALSRPREVTVYRATLGSAIEEIDRMSRIVESLGTLARQDAGLMGPERRPEPVDMTLLCSAVVGELRSKAAAKGVTLEAPDGDGLAGLLIVSGDSSQLRQLVLNLVDNAIKYTPACGHVSVALRLLASRRGPTDEVRVTVADTGVGIAAGDLPHVFERFWRADRARASEGSGLGLAISRLIAESHGGSVTAESRLGNGSVFSLRLPLLSRQRAPGDSAHD